MTAAAIRSIDHLRAAIAAAKGPGATVGLVPTMGALHAGHARLIEAARAECDVVVVSIFVNPLQFDRKDDLDAYPRTLDEDLAICRRLGVDIVFTPEAAEMYPREPTCVVRVGRVAEHLCGRYRPGHFDGVATVVLKLLEIVRPDRAYFGEKDRQQLAVIRDLVRDFNVPSAIVSIATVREPDGLAMSSRNRRLTGGERSLALVLYRALREAERRVAAGGTDSEQIRAAAASSIPPDPRLRLEYLEIVDPEDMQPVAEITSPVIVAGALWVGKIRLIDNVTAHPPHARL